MGSGEAGLQAPLAPGAPKHRSDPGEAAGGYVESQPPSVASVVQPPKAFRAIAGPSRAVRLQEHLVPTELLWI